MIHTFYARELMVAADEQRHGFLKIRGIAARNEVCLMAEAGLVEATLSDGQRDSFAVINRLTDSGREFLRAFEDSAEDSKLPWGEEQLACQAAVLAKWNAKFALGLQLPLAS
jgi:hypothetical protein